MDKGPSKEKTRGRTEAERAAVKTCIRTLRTVCEGLDRGATSARIATMLREAGIPVGIVEAQRAGLTALVNRDVEREEAEAEAKRLRAVLESCPKTPLSPESAP